MAITLNPTDLGYPEGSVTRDFSDFPYRLLPLSIEDRTNSVRETYLRFETPEYSAWIPADFQHYVTPELLYNEKDTIGMREVRKMYWNGWAPTKDQYDIRKKYPHEYNKMDKNHLKAAIGPRVVEKEFLEKWKELKERGNPENFYKAVEAPLIAQRQIRRKRQIKIISIIALVIITGGLFCFSSLFKTMFNEISKPKKE